YNGESTDEFGDKTETFKVLCGNEFQQVVFVDVARMKAVNTRYKSERFGVEAVSNETRDAFEGAPTDKQDVFGVDCNHLLIGVLPSTLRGNVDGGSLQKLEQ